MREKEWARDNIMELMVARLNEMGIEFGKDISEPIALMCYHKTTTWSGVIKLYLKSPKLMVGTSSKGSDHLYSN